MSETPIVHAVMYRDYQIGTLCDSRAWGPPMLFSAVTDDVTCPRCREKIDGGRPRRTQATPELVALLERELDRMAASAAVYTQDFRSGFHYALSLVRADH